MVNEFIIDFDRLNQLTCHPNDNATNALSVYPNYMYAETRKLIKSYMTIYTEYTLPTRGTQGSKISEDSYLKVVEILHFNRILISSADIRDGKINKVLE